jgi:hypothetical protein
LLNASNFLLWTQKMDAVTPVWQISLTKIDSLSAPTAAPVILDALPDQPQPLDPGLWSAIFGAGRLASTRIGNHALRSSWRLSHDITTLHYRHRNLRYLHAQRQFQKRQGPVSPDIQAGIDQYSPPPIFLYPLLQTGGKIDAEISARATAQVTDRAAAIDFRTRVIDQTAGVPELLPLIQHRIDYAIDLLQDEDGQRLLALALYAVYRHCVLSFIPANQQETSVLGQLVVAIESQAPGPDLATVQNYVEFLIFHRRIFHRRKPDPPTPLPPPPDFHQLLGLVNHYPAMLRPLGLAFDLTVPLKGNSFDGYYDVKVQAKGNLVGGITPTSNTTVCRVGVSAVEFFSAPSDDPAAAPSFISGRYLNLTPDFFNLADEDADGTSLKVTDQVNNSARAIEYTSSAPTSLNPPPDLPTGGDSSVRTPASSANPTQDLPSDRTIGISLFQDRRLQQLEGVIKKTSGAVSRGTPTPPPVPVRLHASDLMLGVRVDVKYNNRWYSLCRRSSIYEVKYVGTNNMYKKWSPSPGHEQDADEGFVTFAATQSDTTNGGAAPPNQTQTQVHQSVFTWTGWSLAVPKPGFTAFNPPSAPPSDDPTHQYLRHLARIT